MLKWSLLVCWVILCSSSMSWGQESSVWQQLFQKYHRLNGSARQIDDRNRAMIEQLNRNPIDHRFGGKIRNVSKGLAAHILSEVMRNPVASLHHIDRYDPEGYIGFCFGRAMTAHLEAIYQDVSKDSIKKAWAIGNLRASGVSWAWHVTTILKNDQGGWWAIDPVSERVVTLEKWYSETKQLDSDGRMALFITDAPKFTPDSGIYEKDYILSDFYHGYFDDLLGYYRKRFKNKYQ